MNVNINRLCKCPKLRTKWMNAMFCVCDFDSLLWIQSEWEKTISGYNALNVSSIELP
jgi:hypothetical protein